VEFALLGPPVHARKQPIARNEAGLRLLNSSAVPTKFMTYGRMRPIGWLMMGLNGKSRRGDNLQEETESEFAVLVT